MFKKLAAVGQVLALGLILTGCASFDDRPRITESEIVDHYQSQVVRTSDPLVWTQMLGGKTIKEFKKEECYKEVGGTKKTLSPEECDTFIISVYADLLAHQFYRSDVNFVLSECLVNKECREDAAAFWMETRLRRTHNQRVEDRLNERVREFRLQQLKEEYEQDRRAQAISRLFQQSQPVNCTTSVRFGRAYTTCQ